MRHGSCRLVILGIIAVMQATVAFVPPMSPKLGLVPIASPNNEEVMHVTTNFADRSRSILMAVPKKRQSKMKTRQRKANWLAKAKLQRQRALTLGQSVLKGTSTSFVYLDSDEDDSEEIGEDDETDEDVDDEDETDEDNDEEDEMSDEAVVEDSKDVEEKGEDTSVDEDDIDRDASEEEKAATEPPGDEGQKSA